MSSRPSFVLSVAAAALVAVNVACALKKKAPTPAERIERGKYLVAVVGCSDCHTPMKMGEKGPEPDLSHFLAGHPASVGKLPPARAQGPWLWAGAATNTAVSGPWGTSYAANLTPDQMTGMGVWTEDMFVKAMREGKHMGQSRPIMPPMPWQDFGKMTDEDLVSIFAYLKSLPPVSNRVPDYEPPAPPQKR